MDQWERLTAYVRPYTQYATSLYKPKWMESIKLSCHAPNIWDRARVLPDTVYQVKWR